jgi:hypothetical protein
MSTFESAKKARKILTGIEPISLQLFISKVGRFVVCLCTMDTKVLGH